MPTQVISAEASLPNFVVRAECLDSNTLLIFRCAGRCKRLRLWDERIRRQATDQAQAARAAASAAPAPAGGVTGAPVRVLWIRFGVCSFAFPHEEPYSY
jgi:hypothetical protein